MKKSFYYLVSFILFTAYVIMLQGVHMRLGSQYQEPEFVLYIGYGLFLNGIVAAIMLVKDTLTGKNDEQKN